ncbi:cell division protein ZapA [Psychrobacter alimentarius]|uniref:cell division protein ZapA n=1 Tax=Psychrobacter alimentarius TaxID=261164 RepID=UPI001918F2C0|nr:cell division protein ZapA [Psychrobacter alimentarius]
MTNNHPKSLEEKLAANQTRSTDPKSQKGAATGTGATTVAAQSKPNTNSTPEPQIKKVDISIAGVTYPIYCPVHEQEELRSAVFYINDYAQELRKDAPSLSQENLLVLCCLNLYEKIHANQRDDEDRLQESSRSDALLDKILKDAQSIL